MAKLFNIGFNLGFNGGINTAQPPFKSDLAFRFDSRTDLTLNESIGGNDAAVVGGKMALLNGGTSSINIGGDVIEDKAVTIMGWINPYTLGASSEGRIIDNRKTTLALHSGNKLSFTRDGVSLALSDEINLNQVQFFAVTSTLLGVSNFYIGNPHKDPILSGVADQAAGSPEYGSIIFIGNNYANTRGYSGLLGGLIGYEGILTMSDIINYANGIAIDGNILFDMSLNDNAYESISGNLTVSTDIEYIDVKDNISTTKIALDKGYYEAKDGEDIDFYILMGQSNMSGFINDYQEAAKFVPFSNDSIYSADFEAGNSPYGIVRNLVSNYWGVEMSLSNSLRTLTGRKSAFVKVSQGTTGFGRGNWVKGGDLYNRLISAFSAFKSELESNGYNIRSYRLVSILGEDDSTDETWANNYYNNYVQFVSDLETDLSISIDENVMPRIHSSLARPYVSTIRAAQDSLAANFSYITTVNTDTIGLKADNVHYNTEGLIELGNIIADLFTINSYQSVVIDLIGAKVINYNAQPLDKWVLHSGNKLHNLIDSYANLQPSSNSISEATNIVPPPNVWVEHTTSVSTITLNEPLSLVFSCSSACRIKVSPNVTNQSGNNLLVSFKARSATPLVMNIMAGINSTGDTYKINEVELNDTLKEFVIVGKPTGSVLTALAWFPQSASSEIEILDIKYIVAPSSYEMFNRSNEIIYNSLARSGYYDSSNPYLFHISELNYDTWNSYLNAAYQDRNFTGIKTNYGDQLEIFDILSYLTQKSGDDLIDVLKYIKYITPYQLLDGSDYQTTDGVYYVKY